MRYHCHIGKFASKKTALRTNCGQEQIRTKKWQSMICTKDVQLQDRG
jgi:hypothetical protein